MTRSKEDSLAYQRGYQAGRKRVHSDRERELARAEREQFRRQVFLAILPELVRAPWQKTVKGEKVTWSTMQEFVDGAWKFADLAEQRTSFTGLTLPTAEVLLAEQSERTGA